MKKLHLTSYKRERKREEENKTSKKEIGEMTSLEFVYWTVLTATKHNHLVYMYTGGYLAIYIF